MSISFHFANEEFHPTSSQVHMPYLHLVVQDALICIFLNFLMITECNTG
jgi:hypothetical protein